MSSMILIIIGMSLGFSGGVVLAAVMFAAKQADTAQEHDYNSLARVKSV